MRLICGVLAACIALSPAGASARKERWRDASSARSRGVGIAYARCAVRQDRGAVVAFLNDPVGTNDAAKLKKALPPECLNRVGDGVPEQRGQLVLSDLLVRGLLFEALYAGEFKRHRDPRDFERAPPQSYAVAGSDPAGQTLRRDYRALMRIGDCAARAAPDRVRALLLTPAASDDEGRAVADLRPAWSACLPGRRDLPFSVEMMRATLVEPFYRLSHAVEGSIGRGGDA